MKLTLNQIDLKNALNVVSKAIPSKPTHAVLGCFKLETNPNFESIKITSFDLSTCIQYEISANITEAGSIAIPAKVFIDIISRLPSSEISFIAEEDSLIIKTETGEFRIGILPSEEYPQTPSLIEGNEISLSLDILHAGIKGTLFCASTDETKQILTGVNIKSADYLYFAATDGHRLAVSSIECENIDLGNINLTIPSKVLASIDSLLNKEKVDSIKLRLDDEVVQFITDDLFISCRRLQGAYPNYDALLPKTFTKYFRCDRRSLLQSVELVSVLADTKNSLVTCEIEESRITLNTSNTDIGNGSQYVPGSLLGEPIRLAFNTNYLLEGLKNIQSSEVLISMNDLREPVVIKDVVSDDSLYLIMPVQIRDY